MASIQGSGNDGTERASADATAASGGEAQRGRATAQQTARRVRFGGPTILTPEDDGDDDEDGGATAESGMSEGEAGGSDSESDGDGMPDFPPFPTLKERVYNLTNEGGEDKEYLRAVKVTTFRQTDQRYACFHCLLII